jgi:hypothetical protein
MGSSSLNADVNALERLQIVRGRNSSYLGSKHGASEVLGCFELALHERLVDHHLRRDVGKFTTLPGLHLPSHRFEVSLHSINTNRNAVDERERIYTHSNVQQIREAIERRNQLSTMPVEAVKKTATKVATVA